MLVAIAVVALIVTSGGDSSDEDTTPTGSTSSSTTESTSSSTDETTTSTTEETTTSTTSTETPDGGTLTLGEPAELGTFEGSLSVTTTDIHPSRGGRFDDLPQGSQLVGVEFEIENVGGEKYTDAPANGAVLRDTSGKKVEPAFPSGGDCSSSGFATTVDLKPGESDAGCVAFTLERGQSAGEFSYTPDSGFADDTGTWSVSGG